MKLLKKDRSELQAASIRLATALCEAGYISDMDSRWIIHRVNAGDKRAYKDLKWLLIAIAEEIGKE